MVPLHDTPLGGLAIGLFLSSLSQPFLILGAPELRSDPRTHSRQGQLGRAPYCGKSGNGGRGGEHQKEIEAKEG